MRDSARDAVLTKAQRAELTRLGDARRAEIAALPPFPSIEGLGMEEVGELLREQQAIVDAIHAKYDAADAAVREG